MIKKGITEKLKLNYNSILNSKSEISIYHNNKNDGNYAYLGEKIKIKIKLERKICSESIVFIFQNAHNEEEKSEYEVFSSDYDTVFDYYLLELESDLLGQGLFIYNIKINSINELFICNSNGALVLKERLQECVPFQLTVSKKTQNETYSPGIIYHIFVDRFSRGGKVKLKKESEYISDWSSELTEFPEYPGAYLKNNTFYGGTLYGIIEKLDYLKNLGTEYIYLSPIFESPSNHKYDTADYMSVDESFGGNKALERLIEESKKYGIKIILDGVFNHTGADSIYFNKYGRYNQLGAYQSKDSKYYNWYSFEEYPEKYTSWWGIDILPRINYNNSTAEDFFLGKGGVIEKWIKKGIAGFRLDVVDELSDEFLSRMKTLIHQYNSEGLLIGEVWEDGSNKIAYGIRKKYFLGDELDGVMNYPLRNGIIDYIRNKKQGSLQYALNVVYKNMPGNVRCRTMNLLGSHDTTRLITALSGEDAEGKTNCELLDMRLSEQEYLRGVKRVIAAYTIINSLNGHPCVYYGDEVGMQGYCDPFNRRTFPWGSEEFRLLDYYKKINKIRSSNSSLYSGDLKIILLDSDLLILEKRKNRSRCLLVYNNSSKNVRIDFSCICNELIDKTMGETFTIESERAYIFKVKQGIKLKIIN